ncbi:MAG: SPOR domain-containing protein [bacterium]
MRRLCLLLGLLVCVSSHADQLVFGSFKSAVNAQNWAQKLSAQFDQPMGVETIVIESEHRYRVQSGPLTDTEILNLRRRADSAGVTYWRLYDDAGDLTLRDRAVSPIRTPPPLGAPRLAPPSPVTVPADSAARAPQPAGQAVPAAPAEAPSPPRAESLTRLLADTQWDLGLQTRTFFEQGTFGQDRFEGSASIELQYYRGWQDDRRSITISPFLRIDSADSQRTHADLREFYFSSVGDNWDLHVGAKRIFWGVTEFHHLVDIVNQTDLVENLDTEDKLGQPMLHLSLIRDWGVLDVMLLTGFRERTFPGTDGRLRLPLKILDDVQYESGAEQLRTDVALRWSHYLGPFEVGVHHFSGTGRDPSFIPVLTPANGVALQPFYPVIDQTGVDAQMIFGDWAFKFEGLSRSGQGDRYGAANLGFERTFVRVFNTPADFGLIGEYLFDERGDEAFNTLFENDIALGGRLSLNDFADTKALLGVIKDVNNDDYLVTLEASRRLTNSWLLSVEGRFFAGGNRLPVDAPAQDILDPRYKTAWLQNDDYLQVEFKKFF